MNVASNTSPARLAGAIIKSIKDGKSVELFAIGAGAVNQSIKAIALVNNKAGINYCVPAFCDIDIDGEARKGIKVTLS